MKHIVCFIIIAITLFSCSPGIQPLYYWGGNYNNSSAYENRTYDYYKQRTPQTLCAMICTFENMVKHPGGTSNRIPPGICAEYAYILSLPESADAFAQFSTASQKQMFTRSDYGVFFASYARELFAMEMEIYPESAKFIKPIIDKLEKR